MVATVNKVKMAGVSEEKSAALKKKPRYWTDEEDRMLASAVQNVQSKGLEKHAGDNMWKKVAMYVPNRAWRECLQRWTKVLVPGLKKGKWSPLEDDTLLALVNQQIRHNPSKISWPDVSKGMGFRSCKQCRERWINHLDPSVKKGEWTAEEDKLLLRVGKQYPSKWAKIARHIQGRTENTVKVRWKILKRQEWKPEEDRELLRLVAMYPRNWRMIAYKLQGRNERNVKQRLHTLSQERPEAMAFLQSLPLPPKPRVRPKIGILNRSTTKPNQQTKKRKRIDARACQQGASGLDVLLQTAEQASVNKRTKNPPAAIRNSTVINTRTSPTVNTSPTGMTSATMVSPTSPNTMMNHSIATPSQLGLYMQQQQQQQYGYVFGPGGLVQGQQQAPMQFFHQMPYMYNTPSTAMVYMASLSAQMNVGGHKAGLQPTVNNISSSHQAN